MPTVTTTKTFVWNVKNKVSVTKVFKWYSGMGVLHWYRVEMKPTREDDKCDTLPGHPNILIYTIMASSVDHLCNRMDDLGIPKNKVINKVGKWSRPALRCDRTGNDCNELISVDFVKDQCRDWLSGDDVDELDFNFRYDFYKTSYNFMSEMKDYRSSSIIKPNTNLPIFLEVDQKDVYRLIYNKPLDKWYKSFYIKNKGNFLYELAWKDKLWQFGVMVDCGNKKSRFIWKFDTLVKKDKDYLFLFDLFGDATKLDSTGGLTTYESVVNDGLAIGNNLKFRIWQVK